MFLFYSIVLTSLSNSENMRKPNETLPGSCLIYCYKEAPLIVKLNSHGAFNTEIAVYGYCNK